MGFATTRGWAGSLSGEIDGLVLVDSKYGTVMRTAPTWRQRAKSPRQQESEARMARASGAFGNLSRAEAEAWTLFGETLAEPHPRTGVVAPLSGQQAFNRLALRLLMIDPLAEPPREPPRAPFFGDGVRVLSEAASEGVRFRADAPSREGVLCETLLQPLASGLRRTYLERYRTQRFVAFAPGALDLLVPCSPGWQAAAVRFVEASTGRATALVELGVVWAGCPCPFQA